MELETAWCSGVCCVGHLEELLIAKRALINLEMSKIHPCMTPLCFHHIKFKAIYISYKQDLRVFMLLDTNLIQQVVLFTLTLAASF